MTVLEDRIAMADSIDSDAGLTLDVMFEALEKMPVPEGYKVEIVGGNIYMAPQRDIHWQIIRRIVRALEDKFGMNVNVLSDVRIDFPGKLNGFAPDVAKLRDGSETSPEGRWQYEDVEFVAEVISKKTAAKDYGPKKLTYALAEVPVYLIVDPYQHRCRLFTQPKDGDYTTETKVAFGAAVDLTNTVVGLTLHTEDFPRD
ncbi:MULTISPECIES: Uma2 family endonuclease [unclassified Streptomyces]|uniref:Uma2 family endonuclease n=1 Tax=unclassified Streptomyces TaxID=2593676 RepID=UPI002E81CE3E|nr:Uma2 family endonuclease [Streptomyces sp. NBC_00589]WTI38334.1 Uma2 family endonuclease [Streptomyces sp. NBC_00775]WUB27987.1 Uma2 family endonuclease [Streptomyces sp. NBC_00589]